MRDDERLSVSSVIRPAARIDSRAQGSVLGALAEGVVVLDRDGLLTNSNAAASRILGVDLSLGAGDGAWRDPLWGARDADVPGTPPIVERVLRDGQEVLDVEMKIARWETVVSLRVNYLPLRGVRGMVAGVVLSFRDVSARESEREKLAETQDRLREVHDVARLATWEWCPETGEVTVFRSLPQSAMVAGTQVTLEEWLAMIPAQQQQAVQSDFATFLAGGRDDSVMRFEHVLPSGPVWLEVRSRAVRDGSGHLLCVRGTAQDVSEQELAEHELATTRDFLQATLDSLATLVAVLDEQGAIVMTNRAWSEFASDDDAALIRVEVGANYVEACDAHPEEESCTRAAAALRAILAGSEEEFSMEHSCHSPEVLRWFQMRATRYEGAGPVRVVVTHENISERKAEERLVAVDLDKLAWVARIEEALSEERFVLHAQPILDLASGQIVQRELLIRMRHPAGSEAPGLVPPSYFLPVAEEFGLITQIDRWVIERAAEMAATGLPVEVNVSGRSISDPRFVDFIKITLERTGADPQMLVFEITETTLVDDDVSARAFVARLHGLGCKVALDDFGTGYGGFTYLKQLPIDYLKIDIEFVSDLSYNPASRTVVQAIVKLAQGFGLQTVAEGVEDSATVEALGDLGVDLIQGYHVGRPAAILHEVPA
jgi:EAL domain-containing protein (putative c-di-GMP-specific phosphodiesterase class I)/PAS domain-containing protein